MQQAIVARRLKALLGLHVVTLALRNQRKGMQRLHEKAGVTSTEHEVVPGSERLVELTGSRTARDARV